jgi:hypothetical protein
MLVDCAFCRRIYDPDTRWSVCPHGPKPTKGALVITEPAPPVVPEFDPTSMNLFFAKLQAEGKLPPPKPPPIDQLAYFRRLEEHGRVNVFRRLGRWVRWKLTGLDYCAVCDRGTKWRKEILYDTATVAPGAVVIIPDELFEAAPVGVPVVTSVQFEGEAHVSYPYGSACICTGCDVAVMHIPEVGLTVLRSSEIAR